MHVFGCVMNWYKEINFLSITDLVYFPGFLMLSNFDFDFNFQDDMKYIYIKYIENTIELNDILLCKII